MASGCASGPLVLFAAAPGALARALPDTPETCLPGLALGPLGCVLGFARVAMPRVRNICKLCAECSIEYMRSSPSPLQQMSELRMCYLNTCHLLSSRTHFASERNKSTYMARQIKF